MQNDATRAADQLEALADTVMNDAAYRALALTLRNGGGCECDDGVVERHIGYGEYDYVTCPDCHGTCLSDAMRPLLAAAGITLEVK